MEEAARLEATEPSPPSAFKTAFCQAKAKKRRRQRNEEHYYQRKTASTKTNTTYYST